jgi:single-stranded DNA-binding protein
MKNKKTNIRSVTAAPVVEKEKAASFKFRNLITLCGVVAEEPGFLELESGRKKAFCSIQTPSLAPAKEGEQSGQFLTHSITAWDKTTVAFLSGVKTGDTIHVSGRINNRPYKDKNGVSKIYTEIIASQIQKQSNLSSNQ